MENFGDHYVGKDGEFVKKEKFDKLLAWTLELEEGKVFLETENKKMSDWIKKIEADKEELIKNQQFQKQMGTEAESIIKLQETNNYLETENKKMSDWIKKVEADKEELIKNQQIQIQKGNDLEAYVTELLEKNEGYKRKIADLENEKSKLNYKINKYLSNPKIKKIVESKKLDQF